MGVSRSWRASCSGRRRTVIGISAGLILFSSCLAPGAARAIVPASYSVKPLTGANVLCVQTVGALNNQGYVVGTAAFAGKPAEQSNEYAFVWHNGTFTQLPTSPSFAPWGGESTCQKQTPNTEAYSITGKGAILGAEVYAGEGGLETSRPLLWASPSSEPTAITLSGCPTGASVGAMNESGEMVGTLDFEVEHEHAQKVGPICPKTFGEGGQAAFTLAASGASPKLLFPMLGETFCDSGYGEAINSAGDVLITEKGSCAGEGGLRAVLYHGGEVSAMPAGFVPVALGNASLNDSAVVAGSLLNFKEGSSQPAYSSEGGTPVTLTPANGWPQGHADAVNNNGDIVGSSVRTGEAATLWSAAGPPASGPEPVGVDLNTLIPHGSGLHVNVARSINDRGQILAEALVEATKGNEYVLLSPAGGISGKVTKSDATGLAEAEVEVTGTDLKTGEPVSERTKTDATGEYSFALDKGDYTVSAIQPKNPAEGHFVLQECSGEKEGDACKIVLGEEEEGTADFRRDTLIVDSTANTVNEQQAGEHTCDVTPTGTRQTCTLAQAIKVANAIGGAKIEFDVQKGFGDTFDGDVPQIAAPEGFPPITAATTIDGTSQPEAERVELSGSVTSTTSTKGLVFAAGSGGSSMTGTVVNGYGDEIVLDGGGVTVQGCFLGTDAFGTHEADSPLGTSTPAGRASHVAILLTSSGNQIGAPGHGNVIAAGWTENGGAVGAIDDVGGGTGNVIQGNWIDVVAGESFH